MKRLLLVLILILITTFVGLKSRDTEQSLQDQMSAGVSVEATPMHVKNPGRKSVSVDPYPAPPDEDLWPYIPPPDYSHETPIPSPMLTPPTPAPTMDPYGG
jgi:hypothetical protein